jgi:hypothetical protein
MCPKGEKLTDAMQRSEVVTNLVRLLDHTIWSSGISGDLWTTRYAAEEFLGTGSNSKPQRAWFTETPVFWEPAQCKADDAILFICLTMLSESHRLHSAAWQDGQIWCVRTWWWWPTPDTPGVRHTSQHLQGSEPGSEHLNCTPHCNGATNLADCTVQQ